MRKKLIKKILLSEDGWVSLLLENNINHILGPYLSA